MPIWELDYTPTNANYTTLIDPGVTLTLDAGRGYIYVGADALNTASPAPANAVETITLEGAGGALNMDGNLYVNQGSPSAGDAHNVTLDLSGLDTFTDTEPRDFWSRAGVRSAATAPSVSWQKPTRSHWVTISSFAIKPPTAIQFRARFIWGRLNNHVATGSGNLIVGGVGTTIGGRVDEI